ncbi:MAG: FtsQ-type POTRA domain-containing protein [Dehalococcoidia bacterium]|nr:FtsQ-type POTRA domain-containing protein [Dehalococcoidia bacterium]
MSEKRKKPANSGIQRKIVRRTKPAVGQKQGRIVKREPVIGGRSGAAAQARGAAPQQRRRLAWRPGKGTAIVASLVLFFGLLGGGGYWVYQSPLFEVSHVEVRGNARIEAATIVERSDLLGEHLATADLGEAQRSIYAIPLLSSVEVERKWPDRVVVTVEERQPWGTWEQGGVGYTIDREGVVIGTTPPPEGSPVIVSSQEGSRELGDRVDYQAVDAAAEIYEELPRELGTTVTEVAFVSGEGVQVTTGAGDVAMLGDSGGISYKLAVWAAVAEQARQEGIGYSVIDLRYGNRPVLQ